jgi:hypothetical protein
VALGVFLLPFQAPLYLKFLIVLAEVLVLAEAVLSPLALSFLQADFCLFRLYLDYKMFCLFCLFMVVKFNQTACKSRV